MHITSTNYTVADYCQAMINREIIVNRNYQRSDKVWPPAAKSFLIETILLNYPIPKLSLFQKTDLRSRKTYKEIVDGQQRSQAILEFFEDKFRLSRSSEIAEVAGKQCSELDKEFQQAFLDYSLSVDLLVSATVFDIREVFRRINAYTVPLNPEEKRHSVYQGEFKWFIHKLSRTYDQNLLDLGVLGEKQLTRMADTKLYSEIIHALLNGITRTNAKILDKLYESRENEFHEIGEVAKKLEYAIDFILNITDIHKGPLMRPYNFYSLVLAIIHMRNPVKSFLPLYQPQIPYNCDSNVVVANLTLLVQVLETPEEADGKFKEIISATSSGTNFKENREKRFTWLCKALEPKLL